MKITRFDNGLYYALLQASNDHTQHVWRLVNATPVNIDGKRLLRVHTSIIHGHYYGVLDLPFNRCEHCFFLDKHSDNHRGLFPCSADIFYVEDTSEGWQKDMVSLCL